MEGPPSISDFSPSAGNQAEDTFVGRHPFSSRSFRWDSKRWCEIEFVHPVCSTHRVAGLFWRLRFFKSVARQDRPGNYGAERLEPRVTPQRLSAAPPVKGHRFAPFSARDARHGSFGLPRHFQILGRDAAKETPTSCDFSQEGRP